MEKRKNTFLMIAIVSFLYFILPSAPSGYADVLLDVPEIAQEHSQWCWAGSSQATLDYYQSWPSQCTIANWAFGMSYCCGISVFDSSSPCNYWNYMWGASPKGNPSGSLQGILQHWGVNSNVVLSALAQSTAVSEINAGRPFVMRFGWYSGGGHFLVGYGYDQSGNYLDYMDPWPGNGYTKSLYSWVANAPYDHTWTHTLQITTASPTPGVAMPISPSGTILTTTPTYTWNAVSNSTWYCLSVWDSTGNKIQQWYTAAAAGCASGTGTCSVTPTTEVVNSCQWYIRTYNAAGVGPWSPPLSFTVPPPSAATLVSPSGTITTTKPTYTWNAVINSSWYCLYANDSTGNKINQWYTASQAGCGSGIGTCSVTPTTEVAGSSQWYVRTYNAAGLGSWSSSMSFTTTPPSAATLVSPSGAITTTMPTYTWNAVSNSTWYCLNVNDSTGNKIQQWYTAAALGCGSGTGSCSVTPTTEVLGSCQWSIRTYNIVGLGPWSASLSFSTPIPTAPPVAATLVSPSGTITTTTPAYTWNAVSDATWYCLYVIDSTGTKINQWYTAAALGCGSGTGTCAVTPTTEVRGSCQWYIRTYNSRGLGPWSSPLSFTVPPPGPATLVSPSGTITTTTPVYTWNAVSNSTWYCLYVNDSAGTKINQWYTAAAVGCGSGTGTCSITPTTALAAGAGQWYIRTYNSAGLGPWTIPGMSFTVSP